jgi:hypothetical protein
MKPNTKSDLDHFLQLRLSNYTVAETDDALATVPQLVGFNRCRFIRYAVRYALNSIAEISQCEHLPEGCLENTASDIQEKPR